MTPRGESEAQKRHRIENTERDHSQDLPLMQAALAAQLIPPQLPADEPIDAPWHVQLACSSKWFTPAAKVNRVVVVHCTAAENPASSTANFFTSCTVDSGSTQGIVDNQQGFQSVPDKAVCAGAPPMNTTGLHVEQSGSETRTRAQWLAHIDEIDRLAFKTAEWCKQFGIPVKLMHTTDLPADPADAHGITYHQAISNRYHQSTHQDPGAGYPWDVFMAAVQNYFTGGDDMTPEDKAALKKAGDSAQRFEDYLDGEKLAVSGKQLPTPHSDAMAAGFQNANAFLNQPKADANIAQHKHAPGGVMAPPK
jgi:hypothetical protein